MRQTVTIVLVAILAFAWSRWLSTTDHTRCSRERTSAVRVVGHIYADVAAAAYIPRRGTTQRPRSGIPTRLTIFNLDTSSPSVKYRVGGNGTAVDPKSGHGSPAAGRRRCSTRRR